jgi:hypothetical protein
MNAKILAGAGVLAAALAVGAYVAGSKSSERKVVEAPTQRLLPALDKRINDVARIHLEDSLTSTTLVRADGVWRVEQRSNYPANFNTTSQLLLNLAGLRKVEEKTSNPSLYDRLDVEDMGPNAKGTLVRLSDGTGAEIASVIIGKSYFPPGGGTGSFRYARPASEKTSWLVEGQLNPSAAPTTYIETSVLALPATRFHSVEIVHADGERVRVVKERETDTNYELVTIPEFREVSAPSRPNELSNLFTSFRFDEVFPASRTEGLEPIATVTATAFNGLVVEARTFEESDGRRLVRLAARHDRARIDTVNVARTQKAEEENAANEGNPDFQRVEPQLIDPQEVIKEAADLEAKVSLWAYVIPTFQQDRLLRRNEYYLKEISVEDLGPPAPEVMDATGEDLSETDISATLEQIGQPVGETITLEAESASDATESEQVGAGLVQNPPTAEIAN